MREGRTERNTRLLSHLSISPRMARILTSVCVIAAPPNGPASSRILFPAAATSSGPIDFDDPTYPILPSMPTNAEFASDKTGSMGYRESSRSNVRRPSVRTFPPVDFLMDGRVVAIVVLIVVEEEEEEEEEEENEDDRLVSDRGGWDAVDRSGGGRSTDIRIIGAEDDDEAATVWTKEEEGEEGP